MNDELHPTDHRWSDAEIASQLSTYGDMLDDQATAGSMTSAAPNVATISRRRTFAGLAAAAALIVGIVSANQYFGSEDGTVTESVAGPPPDTSADPASGVSCPDHPFDPASDSVYFEPATLPVVAGVTIRTDPAGNSPNASAAAQEPGVNHVEILYPLTTRPRTDLDDAFRTTVCNPSIGGAQAQSSLSLAITDGAIEEGAAGTLLDIMLDDGTYLGVYGTPTIGLDALIAIAESFRWGPAGNDPGVPVWPGHQSTTTTEPPRQLPVPTTTPTASPVPINFDGIGTVLDAPLADSDVSTNWEGDTCGYWEGPAGLEGTNGRAIHPENGGWIVGDVRTSSAAYRTASGLGVDSTLADLERVYGDDLVVDRADGWDSPTDGLLASYVDVAAVANGDRAITYLMTDDVVTGVKVSALDAWGDDEGCA